MIDGSGAAENYHMRWFQNRCRIAACQCSGPGVWIWAGVSIAGPKSTYSGAASLMATDISAEGSKFLLRGGDLGMVDALVGRTDHLHRRSWLRDRVESDYLRTLYHSLFMASAHGSRPGFSAPGAGTRFGSRRATRSWLDRNTGGHTPLEAVMDRFVDL